MEFKDIPDVIAAELHLCGELNGYNVGGEAVPERDTPIIFHILEVLYEKMKKIEDLELELGVQKLAIKTLKSQIRNYIKGDAT